jgi:hypothetical protein
VVVHDGSDLRLTSRLERQLVAGNLPLRLLAPQVEHRLDEEVQRGCPMVRWHDRGGVEGQHAVHTRGERRLASAQVFRRSSWQLHY